MSKPKKIKDNTLLRLNKLLLNNFKKTMVTKSLIIHNKKLLM